MGLIRFSERAVKTFTEAAKTGMIKPLYIKDVIKYDDVDVTPIEVFLSDPNPSVRAAAAEIIALKGDANKVVDIAVEEKDKTVLLSMMKALGQRKWKNNMEKLSQLIDHPDSSIRFDAISMFRKVGRADVLFTLLFDSDSGLVSRVKRYIEEENAKNES